MRLNELRHFASAYGSAGILFISDCFAKLFQLKFVDIDAEPRECDRARNRINCRTGDGWILAIACSGCKPPQCALAGEVGSGKVKFERLLDIGWIQNRHCQCAPVIPPCRHHIERKCVAARIRHGLFTAGRIRGFGLRRIAGHLHRNRAKMVAINFEDQSVCIERNICSITSLMTEFRNCGCLKR